MNDLTKRAVRDLVLAAVSSGIRQTKKQRALHIGRALEM